MREGTLARRFKLRLSDGTVLAVDFDGLSPWLIDKRAMVQVAGSREWRPIKEVIAEARVAAKYAQKERAKKEGAPKTKKRKRGGRDALPLVQPPPKSGPPRLSAPPDEPPDDAQIGMPRGIQSLADDPSAESPVDEPLGVLPEGAPPVRPDDRPRGAPAAPSGDESFPNAFIDAPPPASDSAPEAPAEAPVEAPPEDHGFQNAFIDVPPETPAPDPVAAAPEVAAPAPPDLIAPDDEPLGILAEGEPAAPPAPAEEPAVAASPEPREAEGFGHGFIEAPPDVPVLVDESPGPDPPAAAAPEAPVEEPLGVLPEHDAPVPAPPSPPDVKVVVRDPVTRSVDPSPPSPPSHPLEDLAPASPSIGLPDAPPPPPTGRPDSPVPADDVMTPPTGSGQEISAPDDSLPVIPFKPPDVEPPAPPAPPPPPARRRARLAAEAAPGVETAGVEAAPVEPVAHGPLVQMLLATAAAVGALFSRVLAPINRLERGEPLVDEEGPAHIGPAVKDLRTKASAWAGTVGERVTQVTQRTLTPRSGESDEAPEAPPLPLVPPPPRPKTYDDLAVDDGGPSPVVVVVQKVRDAVQSGVGALGEWGGRLFRALRPKPATSGLPLDPELTPEGDGTSVIEPRPIPIEPLAASVEVSEPEPSGPADIVPVALKKPTWRNEPSAPDPPASPREEPSPPARSVPRATHTPPPSSSQISTIPLAPSAPEPRDRGDMYGGPDPDEGLDLGGLFRAAWAWTKVLLLLGVVGAGVAFAAVNWRSWFPQATELGRQAFVEVDRYARSGEQNKAVEEAAAQLPQLRPETIRRVLQSSPAGVVEPTEVFRLATEAADRGLGTLSVEEAGELDALRSELANQLSSSEQGRLREYEDTRARRVVFPVENASALKLYAKGARALAPESRERLQALLDRAITAGLAIPEPDAAPATDGAGE